MPSTLTGTYVDGVTLSVASQSPATIVGTLATGAIYVSGVYALAALANATVINNGTVLAPQAGDIGIRLNGGGTLINGSATATHSQIVAYSYGVLIGAYNTAALPGLVVNYGTILSTSPAPADVVLGAGGTVVNAAGGLISDVHGEYSLYISADPGSIRNAGTLGGGIMLAGGGSATNAATGTVTAYIDAVLAEASANVVNAGIIRGGSLAATQNGIELTNGGSLVNRAGGVVEGFNAVSIGRSSTTLAAAVYNAGRLIGEAGPGIVLAAGGSVTNAASGLISGVGDGVKISGTSVAGYGLISNAGVISGTIGVDFGGFAGAGGETVINFGTIASTLGASGTAILFTAGPGTLELGPLAGVTGRIAGLAPGDILQFDGVAATTPHFSANTLTLTGASGAVVATLGVLGSFASTQFELTPDAAGTQVLVTPGSVTQAPCFCAGTRIATPAGEVAIEQLAIGDEITVLSGAARRIKWIGRRSYNGRFIAGNRRILPIVIRRGALADGMPQRDLMVSPQHAMLLRGMLIPAERLVNGVTILRQPHVERLDYLHLELDDHAIVLAEGAPSESFVDCASRLLFQNAEEFARLYPDATGEPPAPYAPRVEDGSALDSLRWFLAHRAGLTALHLGDWPAHGPLDGRVDFADHRRVCGWAFDAMRPHTPVRLAILDHGTQLGEVVADRFRADLAAAGKGEGRCNFSFCFDPPLSSARPLEIAVRRRADHVALPGTPIRVARLA